MAAADYVLKLRDPGVAKAKTVCVGGGGMMNEERQEGEGRGETREITLGSAILNFDLV